MKEITNKEYKTVIVGILLALVFLGAGCLSKHLTIQLSKPNSVTFNGGGFGGGGAGGSF